MGSGLRETKKRQTREALSLAALRMAVRQGWENVLVEDIASAAGVSPRTYNNYFSSKAEAIAWRHFERARKTAELLRERPPEEPLWASITHAVLAQVGGANTDPEWTAGVRLMISEPALQGEYLKADVAATRECAAVIAERTGTDAGNDLYPRLVAAAIGAAIQVTNDQWLHADPPVSLRELLSEALNQIEAGLPVPENKETR